MRSSVTGDAFGREDYSCDNLLCAGSLMQERYMPVTIPKKVLYVPRPQRPVVEVNLIKLLKKQKDS